MKPPILIFEGNNNLTLSETVHEAEIEIEPPDARARTYDIFDADGKRLSAHVIRDPPRESKWLAWLLSLEGVERVELVEDENTVSEEPPIRERICSYLAAIGVPHTETRGKSSAELFDAVRHLQH